LPYVDYNYQEFWRKRSYEDLVERKALHKLLPKEGKMIIDLGANFGRLTKEYGLFENIYLSDGAKSSIIQARRIWTNKNIYFLVNDLSFVPIRSHIFDVVVCVRTIHHLNNPDAIFSEAKRLLKPGGSLILEFANKHNIKQIFLNRFGLSKRNISDIEPTRIGDSIKNFHPNYILNYLFKHGFECKQILGVSIFRFKLFKFIFPKVFLVWLDEKLQNINGRYLLTPSIFLRAEMMNVQNQDSETRLQVP
jgi:SAM-dependent methyltransferase